MTVGAVCLIAVVGGIVGTFIGIGITKVLELFLDRRR